MTALLEVVGLEKHFPVTRGVVFQKQVGTIRAVDGISFSIERGKTLGLVGESGCGKSTTGRAILRLHEPTAGEVRYRGEDLIALRPAAMRERRRSLQIIFQDPYASLDPRMTIGSIVAEPLRIFGVGTRSERRDRVASLMEEVGLDPRFVRRYPHEFSGGQRQRIGIARALALEPEFIVCDEPVSALDVSIQAQIINLLQELQEGRGLTYLFIAHDLAVVRHISDEVAVMYLGRIVEKASYRDIYERPLHPYSRALLSAVPVPDPVAEREREHIVLEGTVPSPTEEFVGCPFYGRCPSREDRCQTTPVPLREVGGGHEVACLLAEGYESAPA